MRKVPFVDYPKLWNRDREALLGVIDLTASKGSFIMQEDLALFEKELASYTSSEFSVGVGNATDAMEIFLQALSINKGDEIIISSHTMLATASAIIVAGGTPVPVDIGYDNLIDPESISEAINENTVGIMPTQLNGRTCNMDEILTIANKNGLFVVEDSAQALGSKFKNKSAGTFGLASCISFFPAKVLGCLGDAGAILTSDKEIFEKVYQIHDHGRNTEGEVSCWGRNSRLDNIQAAVLRHQMLSYSEVIFRRREIASMYESMLCDLEEINLPQGPNANADHFDVYQNYELTASNRDSLKEFLSNQGIGTLIQWGGKGVHQFTNLGFNSNLPKTEKFFKECIMLPMNIFLSDDDVMYVAEKVTEFYRS